jgi:hypothetical protein
MTRKIAIDPSVFVGEYPYRDVPHPDPEPLIRVMHRDGIAHAWVGHLPAPFREDPAASNSDLMRIVGTHRETLSPVLAINPSLKGWEQALDQAERLGVPAIRTYPAHWKLAPEHDGLRALAVAAGDRRIPLILTVRFEDLRQRDARDTAGDLHPQVVRTLARLGPQVRLIVSAAGKDFIEEVHWGLTPDEQRRVVWDISWIWGPPEDHLAKLFQRVGSERFCFGSQWPLRLVQSPFANLELLPQELLNAPLADLTKLYA